MANLTFDVQGASVGIGNLQLQDILTQENIERMLYGMADIVVEELRRAYRAAGHGDTGATERAIKYRKHIKWRNGIPSLTVTVSGKRKDGQRYATVAFVLNYGRKKEYGQITGSYFWNRAIEAAEPRAVARCNEIIEQALVLDPFWAAP